MRSRPKIAATSLVAVLACADPGPARLVFLGLPPVSAGAHSLLVERPNGAFDAFSLDDSQREITVALGADFGSALLWSTSYAETLAELWLEAGPVTSADPADPYTRALPRELDRFQARVDQHGGGDGWSDSPNAPPELTGFRRSIPPSLCARFSSEALALGANPAPPDFLFALSSSTALVGVKLGPIFFFDGAIRPVASDLLHCAATRDSTGELWFARCNDGAFLHGRFDPRSSSLNLSVADVPPLHDLVVTFEVVRTGTTVTLYASTATTGSSPLWISSGGPWRRASLPPIVAAGVVVSARTASSGEVLFVFDRNPLATIRARGDSVVSDPIPTDPRDAVSTVSYAEGLGFLAGTNAGLIFAHNGPHGWRELTSLSGSPITALAGDHQRLLIANASSLLVEYAPQVPSSFCPQHSLPGSLVPTAISPLGERWLVLGHTALHGAASDIDGLLVVVSTPAP